MKFGRMFVLLMMFVLFGWSSSAHAMLNPELGRFMQQDPFGSRYIDTLNLYQTCRNNPFNLVDPLGDAPDPSWDPGFEANLQQARANYFETLRQMQKLLQGCDACELIVESYNELEEVRFEAWLRAAFHWDIITPGPNARPISQTPGMSVMDNKKAQEFWWSVSEEIHQKQGDLMVHASELGCDIGFSDPDVTPLIGGHTPGRDHQRKSQPQKKERFQNKAKAEREAKEKRYEEAKKTWEGMNEDARNLRPELNPERFKP